jgi:hypothetical protein
METIKGIKDGSLYRQMLAQTVVASRPKEGGAKPGAVTEALTGVSEANAALVKAITAYEALPEDATPEERAAAYAPVEAAQSALQTASGQYKVAAAGNKNAASESAIAKNLSEATALPEGVAVPDAPVAPEPGTEASGGDGAVGKFLKDGFTNMMNMGRAAPEAPAQAIPTAPAPAVTPPGNSALPSGDAAVIQKAKEAIAAGAPRDKVIERLKSAGINTEGL